MADDPPKEGDAPSTPTLQDRIRMVLEDQIKNVNEITADLVKRDWLPQGIENPVRHVATTITKSRGAFERLHKKGEEHPVPAGKKYYRAAEPYVPEREPIIGPSIWEHLRKNPFK